MSKKYITLATQSKSVGNNVQNQGSLFMPIVFYVSNLCHIVLVNLI